MRKLFVIGMLVVFLGSMGFAGDNQPGQTQGTAKISKYVWVTHSKMASGKASVFDNVVRQFRQAADTTASNFHWIAGCNITGDGGQATFVSFHDSFASIDDTFKAFEKIGQTVALKNANFEAEMGASEESSHSMLLKYRDDISYNPGKVDLAYTTRWKVTTIRLKPGSLNEMTELIKESIALRKKGGIDEHWVGYQVLAGIPGPAIVLVTPLRSLADLDTDHSEAMKALVTPTLTRQFDTTIRNSVVSAETTFLAARPDLSRPPQTVLAANPDFWSVKDTAPVMAKGKKSGRKAPVEPAALKETSKR